MKDEAPKSALEIAMERLAKKDAAEGTKEPAITGAKRAEIADLKRVYEAKLAEKEILHRSQLLQLPDHEARAALEAEYRRERERILSERDRKLEAVRKE
jgi:hypothetical protein